MEGVAGVVHDDHKDALFRVHSPRYTFPHLFGGWAGKYRPRDRGAEESWANEATEGWLMAAAASTDESNLRRWGGLEEDDVVLAIDVQQRVCSAERAE